ncbi:MAG TPA: CvpA family protein, partial [Chitinophagaceae bacterium]|nr:CvpA family protein [Chitinophagaceae bacterium]
VFILLMVAAFRGLRKGLVIAVFSLLAFIVGLAAAMKLSAVAAQYIGRSVSISERWLPVVAFIVVFLIVVFLVRLWAKVVERVLHFAMLGWFNKVGGIVFYALLYIFIFSIVLFYANGLGIIKKDTIQASHTYGYILPLAPKVIEGLGLVIPFFKNMFADLGGFFENVLPKAP